MLFLSIRNNYGKFHTELLLRLDQYLNTINFPTYTAEILGKGNHDSNPCAPHPLNTCTPSPPTNLNVHACQCPTPHSDSLLDSSPLGLASNHPISCVSVFHGMLLCTMLFLSICNNYGKFHTEFYLHIHVG